MTSLLGYAVALIVSLIGLLFTFLMVLVAFIIACLTVLTTLAFIYYVGKSIVVWVADKFFI